MSALVRYKELYRGLESRLVAQEQALSSVLPDHLSPKRFLSIVLAQCVRTPKLLECDPKSIVRAVSQGAECGLQFTMGEAYLVPFWNERKRTREAQFVAGYRGLIKLAVQGDVLDIQARIVHESDAFTYMYGSQPHISHVPARVEKGEVYAAYAIAFFPSNHTHFEVMVKEDLDSIRTSTKSRDPRTGQIVGPWATHRDEMYRKCPVRRLCKYLPLSPQLGRALEYDAEAEIVSSPERLGGDRTSDLKRKLAESMPAPALGQGTEPPAADLSEEDMATLEAELLGDS